MNYADRLLDWFDENKRDMPWRRRTDAYGIWVSEVMLQQTQVATVIPYYIRFMERFPTSSDLAKATLEEVHTYWQGLGYYRRGENLWKGAKVIEERWQGKFPEDPALVNEIPGIGPYTLGAICSIAFHLPLPAVDGNVMRILSRQFCISDDIGIAKNRKIFEHKVMELMPNDPNRFNQALMELGALICTPKSPKCQLCPVEALCMAHKKGEEEAYPVKAKKVKVTEEHYYAILLQKGDRYYMEKRPESGLLANMFGFPLIEMEAWAGSELSQSVENELEKVTHVFTHKKWHMRPVIIKWSAYNQKLLEALNGTTMETTFVNLKEMKSIPVATAFKKVIKEI